MPPLPQATARSARARFDLARAAFTASGLLLLGGGAFAVGLHAGAGRTALYQFVAGATTGVRRSFEVTASEGTTLLGVRPEHFLQVSPHRGAGVTVNGPEADPSDLVLVAGFFGDTNELRLLRRDGSAVARWPVRYYDLFADTSHFPDGFAPATNWNIDIHGAVAMPDGSVVFNFEWGGLVRLDRCGRTVWTIARQTHHSVERAEAGGFWVLGRRLIGHGAPFPPFEAPLHEDTILRVADDGRILSEHSAVRLFYDSGLEALLTANGVKFHQGMDWDRELLHTNKVEELPSDLAGDFPLFEAGDLAVSFRDQNMVAVVDRDVRRIKWWSVGPWLRQHDPEFVRGGRLLVFNNNTYPTAFGDRHADFKIPLSAPAVSTIVEIDPVTRASRVRYGGRPGQELLSVIKGKVEPTPAGGLLITEAQRGRVHEVGPDGRVVWEYVNRYDDDEVAEIGEARLYPAGYFHVKDWSCP